MVDVLLHHMQLELQHGHSLQVQELPLGSFPYVFIMYYIVSDFYLFYFILFYYFSGSFDKSFYKSSIFYLDPRVASIGYFAFGSYWPGWWSSCFAYCGMKFQSLFAMLSIISVHCGIMSFLGIFGLIHCLGAFVLDQNGPWFQNFEDIESFSRWRNVII